MAMHAARLQVWVPSKVHVLTLPARSSKACRGVDVLLESTVLNSPSTAFPLAANDAVRLV